MSNQKLHTKKKTLTSNFSWNNLFVISASLILLLLGTPFLVEIAYAILAALYLVLFYFPYLCVETALNDFILICAAALGLSVVLVRSPVYSLLSLIAVFFLAIFFLITLKVEFISLIFLIIYIGAIAILFLFVIMMFNLRDLTSGIIASRFKDLRQQVLFMAAAIPLFKFYFVVESNIHSLVFTKITDSSSVLLKSINAYNYITYKFTDIFVFSNLFYTYYATLFILSSLILFVSMIGAIVLALTPNK